MGLSNLSRETKFSGANGDREILIFPDQLTTSRIGNFTRLIHTLAICDGHTHMHTYTHTYILEDAPQRAERYKSVTLC